MKPIEEERRKFEAWISAEPYARSVDRNPKDETKSAWPGMYRDYLTALAWEAWQEVARK